MEEPVEGHHLEHLIVPAGDGRAIEPTLLELAERRSVHDRVPGRMRCVEPSMHEWRQDRPEPRILRDPKSTLAPHPRRHPTCSTRERHPQRPFRPAVTDEDVVRHRKGQRNELRIQVRKSRFHAVRHCIPIRKREQVWKTKAADVRQTDCPAVAALRRRVVPLVQA